MLEMLPKIGESKRVLTVKNTTIFSGIVLSLLALALSLSMPVYAIQGDLDGDDSVDFNDLAEFASQWLGDGSGSANLDGDSDVDFADFALLAENWLESGLTVVINEFVAINNDSLLDGDGRSSDWLELYNTTNQSINLGGWYLTDDVNELTKWQFPSVTIDAYGYLLVFASGQDDEDYPYMDAGGYYHTNFKLDGDGEYLALVKPDGTIAYEYNMCELSDGSLGYPPQSGDISYGIASSITASSMLVEEDTDKKVLIPTSDIGTGWTGSDEQFDDSQWNDYTLGSGESGGVGFETNTGYESYISYDVQSDMYNTTGTSYIRIPFTIDSDPADYVGMTLRVRYDDGCVAYLNGVEIASENKPATLLYNSTALALHDDSAATTFAEYDISSYVSELREDNVLAFHGLNVQSGSSDFLISAEIEATSIVGSMESTPMYFETPTPATVNTGAFVDYVDGVKFSQEHGFYSSPLDVGIVCGDDDAIIRYTADGSEPTMSNGQTYTGWINISETTCLRAMAYKAESGWLPSKVNTRTYIFLDDIIAQSATPPTGWPTSSVNSQVYDYGMDPDITVSDSRYTDLIDDALLAIPTISLAIDLEDFTSAATGIYSNPHRDGAAWERPVSVELINPDSSEGFQVNGGLRIRGGMSRQPLNPKHSFRLFFRSEYGDSKLNYPMFDDEGVDSFDKIDLRTAQNFSWNIRMGGGGSNATWLYDPFTHDSHRDMGQPYSRGRFYHLYINGLYWGLYQTDERPSDSYGESYFGGDDNDYDTIKSDNDNGVIYATDGTIDGYYDLWTQVNAGVSSNSDYYRIQGLNTDGTPNPSYTRYVDVENLIDYMLIVFYAGNRDMPLGPPGGDNMPRNLFAVYNRENPDGFQFIAHDSEQSLITSGLTLDRVNITLKSSLATQANCNPWWIHKKLMSNNEYLLLFADHVHKYFFNGGALIAATSTERWLARAYEIETAIIAESARWGDASSTTPRTKDDDWWPAVNNNINNYFQASSQTRNDIVLSQLKTAGLYPSVGAPVFSQFGGRVDSGFSLTMTASAGTIYYTTDGTDPRVAGTGAVSPTATAYSSAVTINNSITVKARALNSSTWSALNEATFAVGPVAESLRVTEIMYHTYDENNPVDPNTEYIELANIGTSAINLNLVSFTNGIDFTFPDMTLNPDEFVLVVQEEDSFTAKYGSGMNIAGTFTGRLDNGGERIELADALGETIQDFKYKDGWYSITDGSGFSLTVIDPENSDPNIFSDKDGWRASVFIYGSPCANDSAYAHNPGDIVINEILAHQDSSPGDWIELYNTTTQTIDISGWYLSDNDINDANLMKYEIPSSTTIAAGDYIVFTENDHFGACFALSENGDEVYLTSALDANSHLTGYREQEDFGASQSNVAFGRYLKSTGTYNFVAMSSNTPGAANAYPRIGPVVISEIMYHPDWLSGSAYDNDEFDYVELYNNSVSDITLYDYDEAAPWAFTQGIDFSFSADSPVTIPAGGYILVVENPTAFAERFPSVPSAIIYGPYDGKLANDGEKLQISMPGEEDDGERCYIRIDRVVYSDGSHPDDFEGTNPWPAEADGQGYSLTRVNLNEYGNDPANWQAATPTPGE